MIYNFVSGKLIIAKMYDEFNIKSRDWELRSPKWIADAMKYLNIRTSFKEVVVEVEFDNYEIELPCNIRALRGIVINGKRLHKSTVVGHQITNQEVGFYSQDTRYYNLSDGKAIVEYKSGTAKVVYWALPVEWDDVLSMWIPKVPDIPEVQENIAWYVLKIILARGYVHPIYSLTTGGELNNPALMWERTKRRAKNRANAMDADTRSIMAETLSNFLVNPQSDIDDLLVAARNDVGKSEPVKVTTLGDKIDATKNITGDAAIWSEITW